MNIAELECFKNFRSVHESTFQIVNERSNERSGTYAMEVIRLNVKIDKEITDYVDLLNSDFVDDENTEMMINHEDNVKIYSWMKQELLKKWKENLELQEKAFHKYKNESKHFYYMHDCIARQLNLEVPEEFSTTWWHQLKPQIEHELDMGINGYRIRMKLTTPPSSREDSSNEDEEEEEEDEEEEEEDEDDEEEEEEEEVEEEEEEEEEKEEEEEEEEEEEIEEEAYIEEEREEDEN